MTALDFVVDVLGLSSVVCLQKPFRPADLIGAIEAATASRLQDAGAVGVAGSGAS
jgi:hypothetical protein